MLGQPSPSSPTKIRRRKPTGDRITITSPPISGHTPMESLNRPDSRSHPSPLHTHTHKGLPRSESSPSGELHRAIREIVRLTTTPITHQTYSSRILMNTEETHLQRLYWTFWASSATTHPLFGEHQSIKHRDLIQTHNRGPKPNNFA